MQFQIDVQQPVQRAVILVRCATEDQAASSFALQEARCRAVSESLGIEIDSVHPDSGFGHGPAVSAAVQRIRDGFAKVFLADAPHRLGRETDTMAANLKKIHEAGGRVILGGVEYPSTPISEMMLAIVASMMVPETGVCAFCGSPQDAD